MGQFLLSLSQEFLGTHSIRDVADGTGDHQPVGAFDRTQADLDRKLVPVVAQAIQSRDRVHGTQTWMGKEPRAVLCMRAAKPRGHQHLDRLADQLLACETEDRLRLPIHELDCPDTPTITMASGAASSKAPKESPSARKPEACPAGGGLGWRSSLPIGAGSSSMPARRSSQCSRMDGRLSLRERLVSFGSEQRLGDLCGQVQRQSQLGNVMRAGSQLVR